jgi:hypothetical protein
MCEALGLTSSAIKKKKDLLLEPLTHFPEYT